jgi:hypothetical protein
LAYYDFRSASAAKNLHCTDFRESTRVYFSSIMTYGNLNMGIILVPKKVAHLGGYKKQERIFTDILVLNLNIYNTLNSSKHNYEIGKAVKQLICEIFVNLERNICCLK